MYRDAAATQGMPVIGLWLVCKYAFDPDDGPAGVDAPTIDETGVVVGGVGVGDDEFEIVGDTVGDELK